MEKLKHEDYVLLAERTLGDKFFCDKKQQKLLHAALGILTELPELYDAIRAGDRINIGEEIADIYWYASIYDRELESKFGKDHIKEVDRSNADYTGLVLVTSALLDVSRYFDRIKKLSFYGKEIDLELQLDFAQKVYTLMNELTVLFDLDVETILANNINKLKLRYPDRFNTSDAIERNLEAEREALSQNL